MAQITTFTLDGEAEALPAASVARGAQARVHAAANVYWPGWTEITVSHCAAEKGAAVPALLDACAIPEAEVIACGDHLNDLGLFAAAAHSIAPANAHPTVLERAAEIVAQTRRTG